MLAFVKSLSAIYHRQLENETKAANFITTLLDDYRIFYKEQKFATAIPRFDKTELLADGQKIQAISTSLVSGVIEGKFNMISSMISSQRFIGDANINFNPCCRGISRSNHYFAPSLAVAPKDLLRLCEAKHIRGEVQVTAQKHISKNFLIGNMTAPQVVLFCHYDSIGPGATDNAAGTAVLLKLIIDYPETLRNCLFVIAGNEELSYDYPVYWGRGYRIFEKKYKSLLENARLLLTVDCVGDGKTTVDNRMSMVRLGFPIKNLEKWRDKTHLIYGSFHGLMEVYHSDLDLPHRVKKEFLEDSVAVIKGLVDKTAV